MARTDHLAKFHRFREEFPFFAFEQQEFTLDPAGITIRFTFNLSDQYKFYPAMHIPRKAFFLPDKDINERLPLLVFNLGMIELISYWKAAASPRVIIRPASLSPEQVTWWKELYFHGLGEYLWLNSIDIDKDALMSFEVASRECFTAMSLPLSDELIIPVGGGKDSAVTLKLLGNYPGAAPLIMNPRPACTLSAKVAGFHYNDIIEVQRSIDPTLLELNAMGFLNGHTPFSAMLGFVTLLVSGITGKRFIALSNEASASEPTIPGTNINHQYSKSINFETTFRQYIHQWVHPEMEYFSFLRPLNELQIAAIFSESAAFHPVFKSCNAGSKTDEWCGRCSKCLFTAIILAPFLTEQKLFAIFGKDMLNDSSLAGYFDQLTGIAAEKPFDCVGTVNEVNAAVQVLIHRHSGENLPALLERYLLYRQLQPDPEALFEQELHSFPDQHHLPEQFLKILQHAIL